MAEESAQPTGCSPGCLTVAVIAAVFTVVFIVVAYATYDEDEAPPDAPLDESGRCIERLIEEGLTLEQAINSCE